MYPSLTVRLREGPPHRAHGGHDRLTSTTWLQAVSIKPIRPPGLSDAAQGARIDQRLLRGPERDLDVVGHARRRVGRVVPGRGRDARITQEVRVVGHAVDHVVIDVEYRPAGRSPQPGRAEVRGGDVYIRVKSSAAAATEVAAAGELRITGDRPVGEAVELNPAPKAAQAVGAAEGQVVAVARNPHLPC